MRQPSRNSDHCLLYNAGVTTTAQSAESPADFTALTGTDPDKVDFADGEDSKTINLVIATDTDVEGDEQLLVTMSVPVSAAGHAVDELYQTTVVIRDDDGISKLRKHISCCNCKLGFVWSRHTKTNSKRDS